jgi:hypothetical protein
MKKCCECKKIVLPGQQSTISFSPIHKACHQKLISKTMTDNPELRGMYATEIASFERQTGINAGLEIQPIGV